MFIIQRQGGDFKRALKISFQLCFFVVAVSVLKDMFDAWGYGLEYHLKRFILEQSTESASQLSNFLHMALFRASRYVLLVLAIIVTADLAIAYQRRRGKHVRGAQKGSVISQSFNRLSSKFTLGHVPIPSPALCRHFLFLGTTGVGKTLALKETLLGFHRNNASFFIIDIDDSFGSYEVVDIDFTKPCYWNILEDLEDEQDFETFAGVLINDEREDFWIKSARVVLVELLKKSSDIRELYKHCCESKSETILELLKGTEAAYLINESEDKQTFQSIVATLGTYVSPLKNLRKDPINDFSIKSLLSSGYSIRLLCNQKHLASSRNLLAALSEIFITEKLSKEEKNHQDGAIDTVFVLDEISSIGFIPSLSQFLSRGRKYGLCALLGAQDVGQVRKLYQGDAGSLLANIGTKVFFRQGDENNALYASKNLGFEHREEARSSISSHTSSESTTLSSQKDKDYLYLPTEMMSLKDRCFVVKIMGNQPLEGKVAIKNYHPKSVVTIDVSDGNKKNDDKNKQDKLPDNIADEQSAVAESVGISVDVDAS